MKRLLDLFLATIFLAIFCLPMLVIAVLVRWTSEGPAVYWSERVGKSNRIFRMPKFRTMRVNTPSIGMHLLPDDKDWVTPLGHFLRRSSLDELPQLWSILIGDMSFVGPRPVIPEEHLLVAMRALHNVHQLKPGLTGWAQVNGRAELRLNEKLALDIYYLEHQSILFDIKILLLTFVKVILRKNVVRTKK
ncbi:MAG: sugar transferase [Verrucomicrobiales bacterium]|nr:sugar transferase [Verrucomicrobiae bacterium]MCP5552184.1 sugar transferase [Akkermansiaceae bacterium]HRX53057.1 sugar transferase [Verrucomicrobiales bacterium]